jgi:hypothetical protein
LAGRYNPANGPSRCPDYKTPTNESQKNRTFLNLATEAPEEVKGKEAVKDNIFIARTTWISKDHTQRIKEAILNNSHAQEVQKTLQIRLQRRKAPGTKLIACSITVEGCMSQTLSELRLRSTTIISLWLATGRS